MSLAWHLPVVLIVAAIVLDLLLGDPTWMPHPVQLIGKTIAFGESLRTGNSRQDLWRGAWLAIAVVLGVIAATWVIIALSAAIAPALGAFVAVIIAWTTLALRDLDGAAATVQRALERGDLPAARAAMPALVGRDPESLNRGGMVRATIESVAENSSDGVVAPLLYLFVGGPAAAMAYKAVNTLDSMIGHTEPHNLYFGRWAARMDDIANLIPARLSAACLIAAAAITGQRPMDALRVCRADAQRHPSPNAGFPEAAMAGALGIQLGGVAVYDGEVETRPLLGVARREVAVADIATARTMVLVESLIAFAMIAVARVLLNQLWR